MDIEKYFSKVLTWLAGWGHWGYLAVALLIGAGIAWFATKKYFDKKHNDLESQLQLLKTQKNSFESQCQDFEKAIVEYKRQILELQKACDELHVREAIKEDESPESDVAVNAMLNGDVSVEF